jgi:3-oxoacyl-[acyl-carrier protein] reductase
MRMQHRLADAGVHRIEAGLPAVSAEEDTAAAAVFLASDASSWLTGITIDVAGGRVMM